MAEKEGFEPSIPFWGIHDFQSCALGQLRDFSIVCFFSVSLDILQYLKRFVKSFFSFLLCKNNISNSMILHYFHFACAIIKIENGFDGKC